jgi:predicted DNA binding CopG/RHH family protein
MPTLQEFPIRLDREDLKEYKKKAIDIGLPLVEIIRRLLALWFAGKVNIKQNK